MTRLGIVTGMAFEAEILRAAASRLAEERRPIIACHGFGRSAARRAAAEAAGGGAEALLSFGIAGGLDPRLKAGDILVATEIRYETKALAVDADWSERLRARVGGSLAGALAHTSKVITTVAEKAALRDLTDAMAADMESYGVAEVAAEKGTPFAALRVIADTAGDALPNVALAAVTEDGRVRVMRSVMSALAHPQQIPSLIWLGRRTNTARKVLADLTDLGLSRSFFL